MEDQSGEESRKGEAPDGVGRFGVDGLYDEAHESTRQCHGREIVRPRGTEHCLCNNCTTLGSIVTPSGVGGVASSEYLISTLVQSSTIDLIRTNIGLTGRDGISLKLFLKFLEWYAVIVEIDSHIGHIQLFPFQTCTDALPKVAIRILM